MRLMKPQSVHGAIAYEQKYEVSSWASEGEINEICSEGCSEYCDGGGECIQLAQNVATDKMIKCHSHDK